MTVARIDLLDALDAARTHLPEPGSVTVASPKFARLMRKDARVRADQDLALTRLTRSVMAARTVKAERITENTLIRVAIDLLLAHAHELHGSTEDELRHSVTPEAPTSGS